MKASASNEKIVNEVENLVRKAKGYVSPADVASATGYAIYEVNDALARLIELYNARVRMNPENGQVQFVFDYPLVKRGKKSFKELMFSVAEAFWKVFKIVYKASIGVILVFYTILFVLVLLALATARKDDNSFDIGDVIGGLFRGIMDAFIYSMWIDSFTYQYDNYGNRYKAPLAEKNKGKGFIKSVFSFVFGPEHPPFDPLDDIKEVGAFIRRNNGILTASHIVALSGVDYDTASSRLAEYAVKFQGELNIADDGYVIAEFRDMLNKAAKDIDGKIVYYEDEVEAPYLLTGNSTGRNLAIAGMNIFNMIMSVVIISFFSSGAEVAYNDNGELVTYSLQGLSWLSFILGYFPFVFSITFFIIPLLRIFDVKKRNNKRIINIIRKKLIGAFLKIRSKAVTLSEIILVSGIENTFHDKIKSMMERLVIELKGQININSSGEPVYTFPILEKELKHTI